MSTDWLSRISSRCATGLARVRRAWLVPVLALLLAIAAFASGEKITQEQLQRVFEAYQKAKSQNLTPEALLELYQLPNAAPAVKRLVDAYQSSPQRAIPPDDSTRMDAARQELKLEIVKMLARASGGRVTLLNFGKQNGIRSDSDDTMYGLVGHYIWTSADMKDGFEKLYESRYKLKPGQMDLAVFDGDASIPDWRDNRVGYLEFIQKFKKGQAKLGENPEAYREAGSYRAQVERRAYQQGRVTIVEWDPAKEEFSIIRDAPAREALERFRNYAPQHTASNAMDAVCENMERWRTHADFIDRMKYFNRTVGDGMLGLTDQWMRDYITYTAELRDVQQHPDGEQLRKALIGQIVSKNFPDLDAGERESFARIMETAAQVETDKMAGQTKATAEYMKPYHALIPEDVRQGLSEAEMTEHAQKAFYAAQERLMKHGLASVTAEKLRRDFTPHGLAIVKREQGELAAKKLRWETANQVKRMLQTVGGDAELVGRIVAQAPAETQPMLQRMHAAQQARFARDKARAAGPVSLVKPDAEAAQRTGPQEREAVTKRVAAAAAEAGRKVDQLVEQLKSEYAQKWSQFRSDLEAGEYSDEAISRRVRERVLAELGVEERETFNKLKGEMEKAYGLNSRQLLGNLLDLGNADSLLNVIKVYQQSGGDANAVGMTILWEVVSKVPGVSQGDYQSLTWLFIAWQLPAAGQVKLVFDVAKGAVDVLYYHAMKPLENDRFLQVYMGYVESQPAGWSPLVPGWKERQEAVSNSILHFVPGKTFNEKRSNMYQYFQGVMDQKLRANGYEPTGDEYWEKLHDITPAFFRRYVTQYFNAEGDWHDNTTAGLSALGQEEALKARLVQQLVSDFREGQRLYDQADVARDELEEALRNARQVAQRHLQEERSLAIAEAFLADQVGEALQTRFEQSPAASRPDGKRIVVEASPPVVLEGQEVRFMVKVAGNGPDDAAQDPEAYDVELQLADSKPVMAGVIGPSEKDLADAIGDPTYVQPLLKGGTLAELKVYVTRLDYEAVVTLKEPRSEIGRQRVEVRLVGMEPCKAGGETGVKVWTISKDANGQPVRVFEDLSDENSQPWDWDINKGLYLLLRWKECPPKDKVICKATAKLTGGIPPYEYSYTDYDIRRNTSFERLENTGDGECFEILVPIKEGYAGEFHFTGELKAFKRSGFLGMERGDKPVLTRPIDVTFTTGEPRYKTTAEARTDEQGRLRGSFQAIGAQVGRRLARIDVGDATRYDIVGANSSLAGGWFELPQCEKPPPSITVSFPDFGRQVTLTIPLEIKEVKDRYKVDKQKLAELNAKIAQYKADERSCAWLLAQAYSELAGTYSSADNQKWAEAIQAHMKYALQAQQLAQDPNWGGFAHASVYWKSAGDQEKESIRATLRKDIDHQVGQQFAFKRVELVERALRVHDLKLAQERYQEWLKAPGPMKEAERLNYMAGWHEEFAELTFRLQGDVAGARQLWEQAQSYRQRAAQAAGQTFRPNEFRWLPDEGLGPPPGPQ
jgi:hypothetical protein